MRKPVRRVKTPARVAKPAAKTATTAKVKPKATTAVARTKTRKPVSQAFARGASGFKIAAEKRQRQDEEYQRMRETPYDFRLRPGEEAEVVILDSEDPFFVALHKVKINGRWGDEICLSSTGVACPLCESEGKEGAYTMVLTILDRRPYKIKNGPNAGKVIKSSKKLFKVKGRNLAKFQRQYERRKGKWRGLRVLCRRDGEKDAAIGEDLEFLAVVPEATLAKYGDSAVPANYESIFAVPTAEELAKRHKIKGSSVAGSEEFGEGDDYGDEDVGWDADDDEED